MFDSEMHDRPLHFPTPSTSLFILFSVPRKNQTREGGLLSDFLNWKEIEEAVIATRNALERGELGMKVELDVGENIGLEIDVDVDVSTDIELKIEIEVDASSVDNVMDVP